MSNVAPFTRHSRIFSRNSRTDFASFASATRWTKIPAARGEWGGERGEKKKKILRCTAHLCGARENETLMTERGSVASARWPDTTREIINYQSSRAPIIPGARAIASVVIALARSFCLDSGKRINDCQLSTRVPALCLRCTIKCMFNKVSTSEMMPAGV